MTAGGTEAEHDAMREELERMENGQWTELLAFAGLIAAGRKPGAVGG